MTIRNFRIFAAGLALTNVAQAAPVPGLADFFRAQLQRSSQAVAACSLGDGADTESWQMDTFFLDINPYFSVGVPGVVQVQVAPEIQFVWTRADAGSN